jgi:hypothetical protein
MTQLPNALTLAFITIVKSFMLYSDYLKRLKLITTILKDEACDIHSLQHKLREYNIPTLKRQIYRDIKAVQSYFLAEDEEMIIAEPDNKKKVWKIIAKEHNGQLSIDELYGRVLLKNTLPLYIKDEVKTAIQTDLLNGLHLKQKQLSIKVIDCDDAIIKSGFNEKLFCERTYSIFKDLFWCVINQVKIKVKITPESIISKLNEYSQKDIILSPISFIEHNGSIFISGATTKNKILVIDLCEILEYEYLKLKYRNKDGLTQLLRANLKNRFGVYENVDDYVYDIEIEFSRHIGEYLKKFNWHQSQIFRFKERVAILQLKCGINRELLGWIKMFDTKAKIIKPEKLKLLFYQGLVKTTEMYLSDKGVE